ncbi:MAG: glycine-rich domain-containing protein [Limisphaerales bacterium]
MKAKLQYLCILLALLAGIHQSAAQGTTAFTYQGQLHDTGTNANGAYTMTFKLYDAATSGNQIGSTLTTSPTLVNGLFTVNLDFSAGAFNGGTRWLDITVQSGSDSEELTPRVQVLPTPYAQFAAVAATVTNGAITATQIGNGAVVNAGIAANAVNGTNIATGQVVKSLDGLQDFVSLSAGANVALATNGNTLQISATSSGGTNFVPSVKVFESSGTFIVPTGVTKIEVEVWGGGGGGGNGYINNGTNYSGGGGGSGGYDLGVFTVTPGTSYPVTVGSGGNANQSGGSSSFSTMSASGGAAGTNATSAGPGTGGAGGGNSGGLLAGLPGGSGGNGNLPVGSLGGSVWRGGVNTPGALISSGPACGGNGGYGGSGGTANDGLVIVYY